MTIHIERAVTPVNSITIRDDHGGELKVTPIKRIAGVGRAPAKPDRLQFAVAHEDDDYLGRACEVHLIEARQLISALTDMVDAIEGVKR